jgi:DNA sulfur modification protein DndE
MQVNKIRLSKEASERLKHLKARTGLAPNVLSRIGFCLSLSDPAIPNPESYPEEDREFNRYTLLGEWGDLFVALLRQRLAQDKLAEDQLEDHFRAHLNRGVLSLFGLVKSMSDLAVLCERGASRVAEAGGSRKHERMKGRKQRRSQSANN